MTLLLDRRGADVQITEEVVEAIAENENSGKEVITLLFDRQELDRFQITEEVIEAAISNWESGKEVMMVLLDRQDATTLITERIAKFIAQEFDEEVMALLLDRREVDTRSIESVVKYYYASESDRDIVVVFAKVAKELVIQSNDRRGADV